MIEQAFPKPGLPDLMSERTFREPRRRGFDDDVFAPRQPRGFGAPTPRRQLPAGPPTRATVKWFSPEKGFGFVVLDGGRALVDFEDLVDLRAFLALADPDP